MKGLQASPAERYAVPQVVDVDFAAGRAVIKLVPRLDLATMAKDHMSGEPCWHSCDQGLVAELCMTYNSHTCIVVTFTGMYMCRAPQHPQ